jgi:CRISPR-associated protein Cas2
MTRTPAVWLVCYDICEDRRLRAVYTLMRGYGEHLQYSVFRCVLSEIQLATLKGRLHEILDHSVDQILFVPLGQADTERAWRVDTLGVPLARPERIARVF